MAEEPAAGLHALHVRWLDELWGGQLEVAPELVADGRIVESWPVTVQLP